MSVPLGKLASINPPTPEFLDQPDAEVSFMPLASVWPYGHADFMGRAVASKVAKGYTQFRKGDVLVPKITPTFEAARTVVADIQTSLGAGTTELHILRVRPDVDARFIAYVARSLPFLQEGTATLQGVGNLRRVSSDWLAKFRIEIADLDEQEAIADYLDRETRLIDELIAEQRGLIQTLQERRRSVVDGLLSSHGLSLNEIEPPAQTELPPGWKTMMLGSALEKLTNGYVGPTRDILVEEGVRYIQGMHIKNGSIDFERRPFFVTQDWHDARPRINLRGGDVLIVQTGDIGKVAVVPDGFGEASCHALQIARARTSVIDPWYLGAYLGSWYGYNQLKSRATGALHPHLEAGVRSSLLVVPPMPVQEEIVRSASAQTTRIDALIAESEDLIALSQERRAALITAAVTGQINVRTAA